MRKSRFVFLSIVLLLGIGAQASADSKATGGFTAPYFQADYIQDLSEFTSGLVNPALLYRVDQLHFQGGFYRWNFDMGVNTDDDLGYQQMSFLVPIRLHQTAGLSIIGIRGIIDSTGIEDMSVTETGTELVYGDLWFVGHYALRFRKLPWLMIGANPKFVRQRQFSTSIGGSAGYGVGLDLGAYLNPMDHYRFGDIGLSVTLQDIVPAAVTWSGAAREDYKQVMTTRFRVGLRYSLFNDRLILNGEFVGDNMFATLWEGYMDAKELLKDTTGEKVEEWKKIIPRGGANIKVEFIPQIWFKAGWTNNNIPFLGASFNFLYPMPEMINHAAIDVNIGHSISDERDLTMMGKIQTDFGPTREQRESRRMYDRLILAPMNAYMEAMRLYLAGKYWEAGFAFGKVISLFPNFHLNDKATFYLGNSYRFLQLNDIARDVYKEGLAEFTTSEQRPKFLYGLEHLDYTEGKYEDALKNHAFITNLYPESEIIPDADYLAGQIHFKRKNYNAARQLFERIQPEAGTYAYAQYTLAIINVEEGKDKMAEQALMSIVADTTDDPGELLLQDAANTKLGQLYFEQVDLRKAVEAFDRVPEGSPFGDEALLGIAWSWVKVNRPEITLNTIDRLIAAQESSPLIPEAYLVKGYSLMLLKRYPEAVFNFERSIELCAKDFDNEEDLQARREKFAAYLQTFMPTMQNIKKNSLRKPTDKAIAERGDMKVAYEAFSQEAKSLFNFSLIVEDNDKFFKRKDEVLSDAEYALAKASKLSGGVKTEKVIEKEKEKVEKVDDEIQKLEQELQQMNQPSEE
jgi:tetratricopeptide (TPR) repeat protein